MKKILLIYFLSLMAGYSQEDRLWTAVASADGIVKNKTADRPSFPSGYILFKADIQALRHNLAAAKDRFLKNRPTVVITVPNTEGRLERFEMSEASNFTPELQAQFPEIRAYAGIGIDDKYAQIRLSVAPGGIQAMIFRAGKENECIEPYSADGNIYAIFSSARAKGGLPFTCSTEDEQFAQELSNSITQQRSSSGTLKTMRLALSCTAEYANYFGATDSGQVALVLAAYNNTMTRINGVFEKDFALHLNIIAESTNVIYYDAASDPYSTASSFNLELQNNLSANLTGAGTTLAANNAAYDIGHLFGGSGGGGNSGCIGCICRDDTASTSDRNKGSGYTATNTPTGVSFDIDLVAHEIGHQLGCNHTFSYSSEDNPVNVEPGSGSTIMAYAGTTGATDVQQYSDDYFVYGSILQVQNNLALKTCPVDVPLTHGVPVIDAGADYTIPKSTPYKLAGTGFDPGGNPLTFCWEQHDDATTAGGGIGSEQSYPSSVKTNGPNYRSLLPVIVPYRYMPALGTVLNNSLSSTWEATSSVSRTLNFVLTGRDNVTNGALTGHDSMIVTVNDSYGPFDVTSQSAAGISWIQGTTQTITWVTNGAEALLGSSTVDILLSTDGGNNFDIVLASGVVNNGSAIVNVPNIAAVDCRVMVKPTGNIYYDINPVAFSIGYTTSCVSYSNNTPMPVPDGIATNVTGTTVTKTITVPESGMITDVNVTLSGTHTYYSDLIATLIHPDGTSAKLLNRNCNMQTTGFNVIFNDASPSIACASNLTGTFRPADLLSVFNDKPSAGTWTLAVNDNDKFVTGTINNWTVEVCIAMPITTSAGSTVATACDSYTWALPLGNGQTYTSSVSGITHQSVNAQGFPHTETLELTIIPSTIVISTVVACNSYFWAANGQTYTSSGIYTGPTVGCVTDQLLLTINSDTTNGNLTTTAVGSYTWNTPEGNGQTYTTTGIYTSITANPAGCTNVATLNLTITGNSETVNTFILGASCGATISNLAVTIAVVPVLGVSSYTFKVTNLNTMAQFIINRPVNSFALSNYPGITLGTPYQIEVSLNGGINYGAPCFLNTPAPIATIGSSCGSVLASMGQWLYATYYPTVTGYRFRITKPVTNTAYIYDANGLNKFNFNQLPVTFRTPGTIYTVEVALRNTDGTYLPYGPPCNVTTPGIPPLQTRFDDTKPFAIKACPNPFVDNFTLGVQASETDILHVRVYDMLGKLIEEKDIAVSEINNIYIGDNYPSGVYNVIVSLGENLQTLKVVKR